MEYYIENIFKTDDENVIKDKIIKIAEEIMEIALNEGETK